jgi:phage terminase large subunit-like protein
MNYFNIALQYADDVTTGIVPACEYVKQSCKRFTDDLVRALDEHDLWFDVQDFEHRCKTIEKFPHVKGKWAAQQKTLKLSPWQVFIMANLFGFKVVKGGEKLNKRRFREAYIEVPRKNGKTFFIAGIGLIMLADDGEFGAEVYCGATSEKQAFEVFTPAKLICKRDPDFREHYGIEPNAKSITISKNGSKFEPVIGDPGDGASPSCGIADEFHEHKTSNLIDTFITGMGAREQPLMLFITTAGNDVGSPCYDKRNEVIDILKGTFEDDSIFGIIYTIDEKDQWHTLEAQIKANPNYGISVNEDFLQGQLKQAIRSSAKQNAYKTKHLNIWVGAKTAWMNILAFQLCRKKSLNLNDFKGDPCYIGVDLASRTDFASISIVFPPHNNRSNYAVFCKHYLPENVVLDGENTRYKSWHANGWITATEGDVIDFDYIINDIEEISKNHNVVEIPYDPFQAAQFAQTMSAKGFEMVEMRQTYANFSEPMKETEALVLKKQIYFQKDPVLLWMMGNVTAKIGIHDDIMPAKEKRENKIDGVVAAIMAIGRAMVDENTDHAYMNRGLTTL